MKPTSTDNRRRPIEMHVSSQNSRIGFRNIHTVRPGTSAVVGGKHSTFLIFIVPVRARIADIRNVDEHYIFRINKQRYFPGVEKEIPDCLNMDIPVVSDSGTVVTLRFQEYVSPLEQINHIMHSIDRAG